MKRKNLFRMRKRKRKIMRMGRMRRKPRQHLNTTRRTLWRETGTRMTRLSWLVWWMGTTRIAMWWSCPSCPPVSGRATASGGNLKINLFIIYLLKILLFMSL